MWVNRSASCGAVAPLNVGQSLRRLPLRPALQTVHNLAILTRFPELESRLSVETYLLNNRGAIGLTRCLIAEGSLLRQRW